MTQELKPCPFCGNPNLTLGWVEGWESIGCGQCHVRIESEEPGTVKAAWNRRAPDAASEKVRREVAAWMCDLADDLEEGGKLAHSEDDRIPWELKREAAKLLEGLGEET